MPGLVVCDEECFAFDALGGWKRGWGGGCFEEVCGSEDVSVSDVAHVGEVEEGFVVADLEYVFAVVVDLEKTKEHLDVTFAEDAGWADCGCQHITSIPSVVCLHHFVGYAFGVGVVVVRFGAA